MELAYKEMSISGARPKNEDALGYKIPDDAEEWRRRGAISIICDGVGGQGDGDRASQLAVQKALSAYTDAAAGTPPAALLRQMFNAANIAVYDASMDGRQVDKRMATTMTVSLFRHHEVHIGHVGDCRAYHVEWHR